MKTQRVHPLVLGCMVLSTAISGCTSLQERQPLTQRHGQAAKAEPAASQPFVEAYLEYVGPPERWAGPPSLLLHVTTQESPFAQVYFNRTQFQTEVASSSAAAAELKSIRTPSSQAGQSGGMAINVARDQLADLAQAIQAPDPTFYGCLFPVRARLIRADGSVLERQGCRGYGAWPTSMSRAVSGFIQTSFLYSKEVNRTSASR